MTTKILWGGIILFFLFSCTKNLKETSPQGQINQSSNPIAGRFGCNEINVPITDQVAGFTIQQLYLALQADVNTVPQYRARFIQQNPGIQTNAITNLFGSYHY